MKRRKLSKFELISKWKGLNDKRRKLKYDAIEMLREMVRNENKPIESISITYRDEVYNVVAVDYDFVYVETTMEDESLPLDELCGCDILHIVDYLIG